VDSIDAADEWLESWTANVHTQAECIARTSPGIVSLTRVTENSDGSVRVPVGSSGRAAVHSFEAHLPRQADDEAESGGDVER
jgi:hypothetical protein